jgi:uncharacterized membrane protein YebE (DUF533 family)
LLEQLLGSGSAGQTLDRGPAKTGGSPLDVVPDSLKGFGGGMAAGGLAALLLGSKGGRKVVKNAVKLGGVAVLGGLAYRAYNDWQASKAGGAAGDEAETAARTMKNVTPAPEGTAFLPAPQAERNKLALKLLQAMIAAAKADGHIDTEEQERIFGQLDQANLDAEEKGFLMDELRKPLDIDGIVELADNKEQAVEIYAASCIAIDPDQPAEKAYLQMLQARLGLEPDLALHVKEQVGASIS